MISLTSDEIQKALDEITNSHLGNNGFVLVEFTSDGTFVVRYTDIKYLLQGVSNEIEIFSSHERKAIKFTITHEVGPEIIPVFGNIKAHPPYASVEALIGEMGGDQCRNANRMDYYGTITFYAGSIQIETTGGNCSIRQCGAAPALMSNNHVIGRSDAAQRGEVIWTPFRADAAKLECLIPFSCRSSTDVAIAKVGDISGISKWTVRTIGALRGVRRPNIGEIIKKHGARTGYTTGTVTGQTNIKVGSYIYNRVFSTSGGFSCPGDSGAAVVASNNDVVGVLSWGDSAPCESNPRGYFWTFVNPGALRNSLDSSQFVIDIGNE